MMTPAPHWSRVAIGFAVGLLGLTACHSRTELIPFDHCDRFPADTVPLPAIVVRASMDLPGVLLVAGHAENGSTGSVVAILDTAGSTAQGGLARFASVSPGVHRLRVRSFGYGTRDTVITIPRDSGLFVDVPLTRGDGLSYCADGVVEKQIPWWQFW
jgi:hypothetical protein